MAVPLIIFLTLLFESAFCACTTYGPGYESGPLVLIDSGCFEVIGSKFTGIWGTQDASAIYFNNSLGTILIMSSSFDTCYTAKYGALALLGGPATIWLCYAFNCWAKDLGQFFSLLTDDVQSYCCQTTVLACSPASAKSGYACYVSGSSRLAISFVNCTDCVCFYDSPFALLANTPWTCQGLISCRNDGVFGGFTAVKPQPIVCSNFYGCQGAGAIFTSGGNWTFESCCFSGNSKDFNGALGSTVLILTNCYFSDPISTSFLSVSTSNVQVGSPFALIEIDVDAGTASCDAVLISLPIRPPTENGNSGGSDKESFVSFVNEVLIDTKEVIQSQQLESVGIAESDLSRATNTVQRTSEFSLTVVFVDSDSHVISKSIAQSENIGTSESRNPSNLIGFTEFGVESTVIDLSTQFDVTNQYSTSANLKASYQFARTQSLFSQLLLSVTVVFVDSDSHVISKSIAQSANFGTSESPNPSSLIGFTNFGVENTVIDLSNEFGQTQLVLSAQQPETANLIGSVGLILSESYDVHSLSQSLTSIVEEAKASTAKESPIASDAGEQIGGRLSSGALYGIVVGVVAVIAIIVVILVIIRKHVLNGRRRLSENQGIEANTEHVLINTDSDAGFMTQLAPEWSDEPLFQDDSPYQE